ncbi:MAG: hypothetical protein ABI411_09650 [Tahibacter sp.]
MTLVRIRLTGTEDEADKLLSVLHGISDIERLEEVDDLISRSRDDSSSADLSDDDAQVGVHCFELDAPGNAAAQRVQDLAELTAHEQGLVLEFVERF